MYTMLLNCVKQGYKICSHPPYEYIVLTINIMMDLFVLFDYILNVIQLRFKESYPKMRVLCRPRAGLARG